MAVNCKEYDCSGWATRNNLLCADGRTIRQDAFKDNDGCKVPVVWSHRHDDIQQVLGHALLENRSEGVYCYVKFNETENGKAAKEVVHNGDICAFSIYANKLKHKGLDVVHGMIREVSLVLAGANPGALIDTVVMAHGEDEEEEACIYNPDDESFAKFQHSEESFEPETESIIEPQKEEPEMLPEENLMHAEEGKEETIGEIFDTLTDKQKQAVYAIVGAAVEEGGEDKGGNEMKHNVFDNEDRQSSNVLSHSEQMDILALAKSNSVGSLQDAIALYAEQNEHLAHAFVDANNTSVDAIDTLFPEYKDVRPGAPEFIERDQGWVSKVMAGVHKSPISRIRTRYADITGTDLRALGYKKGDEKVKGGNIKLLKRTTDPQTVYRKDMLNRDDIIDITDFDVVEYQYYVMKQNLNEELATAIMIGDGRDEGNDYKISEDHIRPIWLDDELYTIHTDVDIAKAKTELQGSNTSMYFSENYIYAEAMIQAALYSREKYKGSGNLSFYSTPHLLNIMLLARDMNGRRIYSSKAELEAALNVKEIVTAEQFEGKTRTATGNKTKKLLGIFVNLADYQVGSTKGGEITRFSQFDIDFNQEKYLIETRLSGALVRVKSAIVLEEDVTPAASGAGA